MSYTLINALERHQEHPDTFEIPSVDEIEALGVNQWVKLGFKENASVERMWVKIISKAGDTFAGVLDNDPIALLSVNIHDAVKFNRANILAIWESYEYVVEENSDRRSSH